MQTIAITVMAVAIVAGVNLGATETRAVMEGNRQKSHGKYNPSELDMNNIWKCHVCDMTVYFTLARRILTICTYICAQGFHIDLWEKELT